MEPSRNPIRLLLHIPVPWVFVLGYLIGVAVERAWPSHVIERPAAWRCRRRRGVRHRLRDRRLGPRDILAGAHNDRPWRNIFANGHLGPISFHSQPDVRRSVDRLLGEALLLRQFWPMVFLPLVIAYVNWIVIPLEESKLQEVFGEQYDQYRARVRRWV